MATVILESSERSTFGVQGKNCAKDLSNTFAPGSSNCGLSIIAKRQEKNTQVSTRENITDS
jgi:hypothetical protein